MSILAIKPRVNDTVSMTESSLQLMLDLEKNDHLMFESLIELDFCEVYQEKGMVYISEAEQTEGKKFTIQQVKTKVLGAIKTIVEAIQNAYKVIERKILEIFNKDKKLFAQYEKQFDENVDSCTVTGFKIPDFDKVEYYLGKKANEEDAKQADDIMSYAEKMLYASDSGDVDEVNKYGQMIEEANKARYDKIKNVKIENVFIDKTKEPLGKAISGIKGQIKDYMRTGLKAFITEFKQMHADNIKNLQEYEKVLKDLKGESDAGVAFLNQVNKMSKEQYKYFNTRKSFTISMIKAVYANIRRIFITCALGKQAKVNKETGEKEEKPVNASYLMNIGEMSDIFVEEAFEF